MSTPSRWGHWDSLASDCSSCKHGWTVAACRYKPSLAGYVVEVEGRAFDDAGTAYTTGRGAVLVRARSAGGGDQAPSQARTAIAAGDNG